jgi:hypothetical protein
VEHGACRTHMMHSDSASVSFRASISFSSCFPTLWWAVTTAPDQGSRCSTSGLYDAEDPNPSPENRRENQPFCARSRTSQCIHMTLSPGGAMGWGIGVGRREGAAGIVDSSRGGYKAS